MMTAWSRLPNAVHIDRIIASVKAHPDAWAADQALAKQRHWCQVRIAAWEAAWGAAWDAARTAAWAAAGDRSVSGAAWGAIAALIAWDHSAKFLDMTPDELKMWSILSEDPAAILILPAVRAFEQIKELEFA